MRVYYLSVAEIPSRTANSVHIMRMCEAFAQLGHDVTLFGRGGPTEGGADHAYYGVDDIFRIVKFNRFPIRGARAAVHALAVARSVRSLPRPDLIYSRHIYSCGPVLSLGIPTIFESHGTPANRVHGFLERRLFRHASFARHVTISKALQDEYRRRYPWVPEEARLVAHDGASPVLAAPDEVSPLEGRRAGAEARVGYTGSLYQGKGMEVIQELAARLPRFQFDVVGGTEADLAHWRDRCRGLPNLVFHGHLPHSQVPRALASFDVVLAPYQPRVALRGNRGDISRWMSPLKIFEYMAHGSAMVSSDLPVLREILTDERNALLVPPTDLDAWVAGVERLAVNPDLRSRIGTQARDDFLRYHTWSARASRVLSGLS